MGPVRGLGVLAQGQYHAASLQNFFAVRQIAEGGPPVAAHAIQLGGAYSETGHLAIRASFQGQRPTQEKHVQAFGLGGLHFFLIGWHGITVAAIRCLGAPGGWAAYGIPPERIMEAARDIDCGELQAILIPDTAIAMFHAASRLEDSLGKPVISANQATLWDALRLAGSDLKPRGFGRLLAGDSATA